MFINKDKKIYILYKRYISSDAVLKFHNNWSRTYVSHPYTQIPLDTYLRYNTHLKERIQRDWDTHIEYQNLEESKNWDPQYAYENCVLTEAQYSSICIAVTKVALQTWLLHIYRSIIYSTSTFVSNCHTVQTIEC